MLTESESKNLYRQHLPNGTSFDLIHVKGGSYFFGDSDHKITLLDFCIGQYPVTQALWQAVMEDNPAHFKGKNRPVEQVSWYDAAAFCNALNSLTGYPPVYFRDEKFQEALDYRMTLHLKFPKDIDVFHNPLHPGYRLPSETEWEYAARGGAKISSYENAGSDKLEEVCWYDDNSHGETKPVGLKAPNKLNISDMSSNVWEWCADQYIDLYKLPQDGAAWMGGGIALSRVNRGLSWHDEARIKRGMYRGRNYPSRRYSFIGFRVVLFPLQCLIIDL